MASPKEIFMQMLAKKKAGGKAPVNAEGESASQEAKDAADIKKRNTPVSSANSKGASAPVKGKKKMPIHPMKGGC